MNPAAQALVAKLAPKLQAIVADRRDEIIANAGNLPRRAAVKIAFPTLVDEVPVILEATIDLLVKEFGDLTVNDLLIRLVDLGALK